MSENEAQVPRWHQKFCVTNDSSTPSTHSAPARDLSLVGTQRSTFKIEILGCSFCRHTCHKSEWNKGAFTLQCEYE